MTAMRKGLFIFGIALLLISGVILIKVWYDDSAVRSEAKGPSGVDYGLIPIDLIQGRTRFETQKPANGGSPKIGRLRDSGDNVRTKYGVWDDGTAFFSLDTGPNGEIRVTLARTALAVGLVGFVILISHIFLKSRGGAVDLERGRGKM